MKKKFDNYLKLNSTDEQVYGLKNANVERLMGRQVVRSTDGRVAGLTGRQVDRSIGKRVDRSTD